jgi:PDZ domain-containing protein
LSSSPDFEYRAYSKPRKSAGFAFLTIAAVALLGVLVFPTPYVIEQPGPAYNVLGKDDGKSIISISNAKTFATTGELDLLTVQVVGNREQSPNWVEIFLAWMDPARSVLLIDQVFPANQTTEQSNAESSAMMEQSQQEAIAVALKKLGYETPVELYVSEVSKESPSSGQIIATDFIRSVNGVPVSTIEKLREEVNKYEGKNPLTIAILRAGVEKVFEITPIKDETDAYRIGILVGYKYEFPINVSLQLADVGGPSGGMMFALGIYDQLTPGSLTGGNHIAGTGTIDSSGKVGPIGGIRQKLYGAQQAGAKFFLAPEKNCAELNENLPNDIKVFRVANFEDALLAVEKIGTNQDLSSLPTCSTN